MNIRGASVALILVVAATFFTMPVLVSSQAQAQSYKIETIAMVGDLAAGTDAIFSKFDIPVLNANGNVTFWGELETGNPFNDRGIWIGDQNGLTLVAREGALAPGGASFRFFSRPKINDADQVAFHFIAIGESRIAVGSPGNLTLVVSEGDIAPGTDGETFKDLFDPTLNANGEVAFHGLLTNTERGIWAGGPSNLGLIARKGDIAPGAGGLIFKSLENNPGKYQHNDIGQVAFRGDLDIEDTQIDQGIWMGAPGEVILVAREGDEAPGTLGETFKQVSRPSLNSLGQVAFFGEIETGGAATEFGVWLGSPASPSLVLRTGDEAPGTGGLKFRAFSSPLVSVPALNAFGDLGFVGGIDMAEIGTEVGYWAGKGPSLALVIRVGDEAPGAGGEIFQTLHPLILNALGEVAIGGGLKTFDASNRDGIWVWRAGTLELIARQTQPLEIAPGDVRVVSNLAFRDPVGNTGGNDNGLSTAFNDIGQIVFHATFQDGSAGIFLATPGVVANAGSEQTVTDSETVILDGSGSFDPDGTSLQYSWALAGTEIGTGSTPTVGPFAVGEYAITLTVTDSDGDGASNVMVLSVTPSPIQPPRLSLEGACPGSVSLSVTDASPGGSVGLAWGTSAGPFTLPPGACAGTEIGLADPTLLIVLTADQSGAASLDRTVDSNVCGLLLQALDVATCGPSNVASVP